MIFRTIFHRLRSKGRSPLGVHDVGTLRLRVLPTDLDVLGHMNNGVYLSIMDLGRMDQLIRAGVWDSFRTHGYYPVVASETITFRRSLQPWQAYDVETRIAGYDEKAVYVEQRFVVEGEIYAQAFIRARFLKKTGGVVSIPELSEAIGVDVSTMPPPAWINVWAESVALPPAKATAPSVWAE